MPLCRKHLNFGEKLTTFIEKTLQFKGKSRSGIELNQLILMR